MDIKKIVGERLIDREFEQGFLRSGTRSHPFRLGLGTGSTALHAIRKLADLFKNGSLLHIVCVPTSYQSKIEAQTQGLPVSDLNDPLVGGALDWAFDGADQVSPHFNLVKGGGAAHAQEKLIEACASRFVVLVDDTKLVPVLGGDPAKGGFAIPVEIMPSAIASVRSALEGFGASVNLRESKGKVGPVISDNGFVILDAVFKDGLIPGSNHDPVALEMAIKCLPGVLEIGLFSLPVACVYVGHADGSVQEKKR